MDPRRGVVFARGFPGCRRFWAARGIEGSCLRGSPIAEESMDCGIAVPPVTAGTVHIDKA